MARPTRSSRLWLITGTYVAASFASGLILPRVEFAFLRIPNWVAVASAQAFLSAVSSGMMALTAIVFSITLVAAQFSATSFSPRLSVELARNSTVFHALGLLIATFTYSLATLLWVDRGGLGRVPTLSLALVAVLIALSMVYLARLIQNVERMNLAFVLEYIGTRGRRAAESFGRAMGASAEPPSPSPGEIALPAPARTLTHSGEPMSILDYDLPFLVARARDAGSLFVLANAVGDTVLEGGPLLSVHGSESPLAADLVARGFAFGPSRTLERDPKYAIRLFVDVAIRALSPAVNDPTTGVQALDHIADLLARLARREFPAGYARDDAGRLRVLYPTPSWEDFLSLAFDEIRAYGSNSIQVMRRLRAALEDLAASVPKERRQAVAAYLQHLDSTVAAASFDAADRAAALREDRQGLGVTRSPRVPRPES